MSVGDVNFGSSLVKEAPQTASPSLLVSAVGLVGSMVEGACAILVASASVKTLVGIGALAATIKASWIHENAIRIPVLAASAVCAVVMLVIVWNAWRSRRRPAARWRMRPLSFREKLSFAISLLFSVSTLVLVVAEVLEHPVFPLR